MIIQQVIDGMRKGQQVFIPVLMGNANVEKGRYLPVCSSVEDRPTMNSPTFWVSPEGRIVRWIVVEE